MQSDWQRLYDVAIQERIKRNEAEAERNNALRDGDSKNAFKSNNSAIKG